MSTHPIILAHGIARFDFLRRHLVHKLGLEDVPLPDRLHYFRSIKSHLVARGFAVHHTDVGFAESVEERAADLEGEVRRVLSLSPGHTKVHIIAHSMGGLDARHMIVDRGMAPSVCSLTTVGTPHRGSSFADVGREHHGEEVLRELDEVIHLDGFLNLTSEDTEAFNARAEEAEAANEVTYQTYSCWEEERDRVFTPLQVPWKVIRRAERERHDNDGLNDGLVSVRSMRWTDRLRGKAVEQRDFPVLGDHFNEVGWWEVHQLSGKFNLGTLFEDPLGALRSLFDDRREYENQIRNTYLSMAEDLARRFPA